MLENINLKKNKAFTIAEVLVAIAIVSVISILTIKDVQLKRIQYLNNFMTYSAITNIQKAVTILLEEYCTATEIANGTCENDISHPTYKFLPMKAHTADNRGFCDRFADLANVVGDIRCDALATNVDDSSDFSTAVPNFSTSNGMRFYNFQQNPTVIGADHMYNIYVDIDGSQRKSKFNEDVLKFCITTKGLALPDENSKAARDKSYLAASIQYIYSDPNPPYTTAPKLIDSATDVIYRDAICGKYGSYFSTPCATAAYTGICQLDETCEIKITRPSFFMLRP